MGPLRRMCQNRSGPANVPMRCSSSYLGLGVGWPANENGRESHAEVSPTKPKPTLYNDPGRRRLLPNAAGSAKGEAAPLLTLPLMRNPSAAPAVPASPPGSVLPGAAADVAAAVRGAAD